MKYIGILLLLFSSLFYSCAQETESVELLNVNDFKTAISASDVQLVDVRTDEEYAAGKIQNALNIDYYQKDNFTNTISKLNKKEPVYLYCRSGKRSHNASLILAEMGFEEVYDLQGGYIAWVKINGESKTEVEAKNLSDKIAYKDAINKNVFYENEHYKMILFAMKKDQILKPHSAPMDTPLLILEGSAKITIGNDEFVLQKGDDIVLPKDIDHGVYPLANLKFLLIK